MRISNPLKNLCEFFKQRATDYTQWEIEEKEDLFYLLLFAPVYGIPLGPSVLFFKILPLVIEELKYKIEKEKKKESSLWELLKMFGIE